MFRIFNLAFLLPLLVVLAVGLALWGWYAQLDALGLTLGDVLFNALHSVTLSTTYSRSASFNNDWRIEAARVIGTIAFLIAATQAVRRLVSYHVSRFFGRYRRGHLLVVGDHPVAQGVVQAAARRRAKVTWITNQWHQARDVSGALMVAESWDRRLAESFAAPHALRCVVAFANEVEQIAAVRDLRAAAPRLPIVMNFGDAWFAERMDELENISGVRFVSQMQLAVRDLHWRHPPFLVARRLGHRRLHALIFGLGRSGEAVLADLLLSSLTGFLERPRVTIVDPRAGEIVRSLAQRCPALGNSVDISIIDPGEPRDVRILPVEALAEAAAADPISLAYICVDTDLRAVALAVSLQALARREGWMIGPIFTRLTTGGALPDTLPDIEAPEAAGLAAFGATRDFADAIGLFETDPDTLPRMFHEAYRQAAPDKAVANLPWDQLPEELRESNRRLLIHLPAKLATAGVDLVAWLGDGARTDRHLDLPDLAARPDLLERLAELEHDRWMMERHLSGWQYGARRDNLRRLHPDLRPYADLDDKTRGYDRAMVVAAWTALDRSGLGALVPDVEAARPSTMAKAAE